MNFTCFRTGFELVPSLIISKTNRFFLSQRPIFLPNFIKIGREVIELIDLQTHRQTHRRGQKYTLPILAELKVEVKYLLHLSYYTHQ